MKEMKALKKLARDMSTEKEALVQKTERNAAIISHMINEALAKDDELGCLRTSIETLQTGRPDAFVMNGACVPGLPVTLLNSKKEADDDSFANTENPDKVTIITLPMFTVYHLKSMLAIFSYSLLSFLVMLSCFSDCVTFESSKTYVFQALKKCFSLSSIYDSEPCSQLYVKAEFVAADFLNILTCRWSFKPSAMQWMVRLVLVIRLVQLTSTIVKEN